jgi:hypothetical protein
LLKAAFGNGILRRSLADHTIEERSHSCGCAPLGGTRIVDMLVGEQLSRIC